MCTDLFEIAKNKRTPVVQWIDYIFLLFLIGVQVQYGGIFGLMISRGRYHYML